MHTRGSYMALQRYQCVRKDATELKKGFQRTDEQAFPVEFAFQHHFRTKTPMLESGLFESITVYEW